MTVRTFFIGLALSFGLVWLVLIVGPFGAMADLRPIPYDPEIDGREGTFPEGIRPRVAEGSQIYLEEGCTQCHTQLVRPEYLGTDTFRPLASGTLDEDGNIVVPPRPTHPADFFQVDMAPLGLQRIGPDLSNVGVRRADRAWHYAHLYNPRSRVEWSIMPSYAHLFEVREVVGPPSANALELEGEFAPDSEEDERLEVVPTPRAQVLVDYLLQLRHDEPVPAGAQSREAQKVLIQQES